MDETNTTTARITHPETQEFLRRLPSLLACRREMKAKWREMAPSGMVESITITSHEGDVRASGKSCYPQENLNGTTVAGLDGLYEAAEQVLPVFSSLLSRMCGEVDQQCPEASVGLVLAGLKDQARAVDKAQSDYYASWPGPPESWLYDVVRASVFCDSEEQILAVSGWLQQNCRVLRAKNRFLHPSISGYPDFLVTIVVDGPNDAFRHICEVQVHYKRMAELAERLDSLALYRFFRNYLVGGTRSLLDADRIHALDLLVEARKDTDTFDESILQTLNVRGLDDLAILMEENLAEFEVALTLRRQLLVVQQSRTGAQSSQTALAHNDLGILLHRKGDFDGALYQYEQACTIREMLWGETSHADCATSYFNMGSVYYMKGDFDGALRNYHKALSIRESVLGENHEDTATSHYQLGSVYYMKGEWDIAAQEYRKALAIREAVLGKDHPVTVESHNTIGFVLKRRSSEDLEGDGGRPVAQVKEDQKYLIVNPHSGKVLDVYANKTENGSNVHLWEKNGRDSQLWRLTKGGHIMNVPANKALDIKGGGTWNGTNVQLHDCHGGHGQVWKMETDGTIVNPHSGKALDVKGASKRNGANIQIYGRNGSGAQQWRFVLADE